KVDGSGRNEMNAGDHGGDKLIKKIQDQLRCTTPDSRSSIKDSNDGVACGDEEMRAAQQTLKSKLENLIKEERSFEGSNNRIVYGGNR
ncbi:hypothetical protein HN51_069961, partial [Arachis hypogaea]